MKIPTDDLYASIATLERLMGRNDSDNLYDAANDIDERADRAYDDWRQQELDERERRLEEALSEAKDKGVSTEHLRVLAFETGATKWALTESLRGKA